MIQHQKVLTRLHRHYPDVTTIVEAGSKIEITVTRDDEKRGHSLDLTQCALALACQREFKITGAVIGLSTSYLINGKTAFRFKTPIAVRREIVNFDHNHHFSPGTYKLVPFGNKNQIGRRSDEVRPRGKVTGTKPTRRHNLTPGVRERV